MCAKTKKLILRKSKNNKSCDNCQAQEEGGHYCLLHTKILKNMNIIYCEDYRERK